MSTETTTKMRLLRSEECARIANVSSKTWRWWASIGRAPEPVVETPRLKLWCPEDVERWRRTGKAR